MDNRIITLCTEALAALADKFHGDCYWTPVLTGCRKLLTLAKGWLLPGNQRNDYEEWRDDSDAMEAERKLYALIQANFKAGVDTASPEHQALVREFDAMHRWANGPLYVRHQTRHDAAETIIATIARALAPCYAPLAAELSKETK